MGFKKWLEGKKKEYQRGREAERVYSRERKQAYEEERRKARLAGAREAGRRRGRREARESYKPFSERVASMSAGLEKMLDPTGSFMGAPKRKKTPRRRAKTKTIRVDGTTITISGGRTKARQKKKKEPSAWDLI